MRDAVMDRRTVAGFPVTTLSCSAAELGEKSDVNDPGRTVRTASARARPAQIQNWTMLLLRTALPLEPGPALLAASFSLERETYHPVSTSVRQCLAHGGAHRTHSRGAVLKRAGVCWSEYRRVYVRMGSGRRTLQGIDVSKRSMYMDGFGVKRRGARVAHDPQNHAHQILVGQMQLLVACSPPSRQPLAMARQADGTVKSERLPINSKTDTRRSK